MAEGGENRRGTFNPVDQWRNPQPRLVIADSMARLPHCDTGLNNTDILYMPGASIAHLCHLVHYNPGIVRGREVILIMAGTNDLALRCNSCIRCLYMYLFNEIRKENESGEMGLISILPRPLDDDAGKGRQEELRGMTKELCGGLGVRYLNFYKTFIGEGGKIKEDYFKFDGIHLNAKGEEDLKRLIVQGGTLVGGKKVDRNLGKGVIWETRKKSIDIMAFIEQTYGNKIC